MGIVRAFSGCGAYAGRIMRTFAILMAALVMALAPPAASAKPDKTPPGQAVKAEKPTPPGQAKKPDKPEPPGQAKKPDDKPEPPGQTKKPDEKPVPPGQAKKAEPPPAATPPDELTDVQRAVEAEEALPLARIIAVAATRSEGHVINARLVRINTVLLYQLTLLDDAGRSWREYYHARTGNPVVIP